MTWPTNHLPLSDPPIVQRRPYIKLSKCQYFYHWAVGGRGFEFDEETVNEQLMMRWEESIQAMNDAEYSVYAMESRHGLKRRFEGRIFEPPQRPERYVQRVFIVEKILTGADTVAISIEDANTSINFVRDRCVGRVNLCSVSAHGRPPATVIMFGFEDPGEAVLFRMSMEMLGVLVVEIDQ